MEGFIGLYAEPEDLVYFEPGSTVRIQGHAYLVREVRRGAKGPEVAFEGVVSRNAAESIRNMDVLVAERRDLGEEEYWAEQLIGLEVRPGGGRVVGLQHGPAQDRLVIERGETVFEVPFVAELVPEVDVDAGYLVIDEIEGLTQQSS